MGETKIFGDSTKAKVLVIGHDPTLHNSKMPEYCFFADYFFKPIPSQKSELVKYKFAEKLFSYIGWLTSCRYSNNEFIVTNLCNKSLQRCSGKPIFIPENEAQRGLSDINNILQSSKIEIIIAMSQQVNYWLQKLGFYSPTKEFLEQSEPKEEAQNNGCYDPIGKCAFLKICGNKYYVSEKYSGGKIIPIFPVSHVRQYPFKEKSRYEKPHYNCINLIREETSRNS